MCKGIMSFMWLIYIDMFECNEIEMFIYVLDLIFGDYEVLDMKWWNGGDSVFLSLSCMEEVILNKVIRICYS